MRFTGLAFLWALFAGPAVMAQDSAIAERLASDPRPPTIGQLAFGDGTARCTATLIESDVALTSAHCVTLTLGWESVSQTPVTFQYYPPTGAAARDITVTAARAHPTYLRQRGDWADIANHNFAVFRLERPIPAHLATPARLAQTIPHSGEVALLSAAEGPAVGASVRALCQLHPVRNIIVALRCPLGINTADPRPVFRLENGALRLVTIVSGGRDADQFGRVVGSDLRRLGFVKGQLAQVDRRGFFQNTQERQETGARFLRP